MATDDHHPGSTSLFPDPQESFARAVSVPPPARTTDPTPTTAPPRTTGATTGGEYDPVADDHPGSVDDPDADADGFVDDTDTGFVEDTAGFDGTDVAPAQPMWNLDGDLPPQWVRTHVPADPLVPPAPNRRFRRTRPAPAPAPATDTPTPFTAAAEPEPAAPAGAHASTQTVAASTRRRRRGVIAVGVAAAVVVLSAAGAAAALTAEDDTSVVTAPTATDQTDITSTTSGTGTASRTTASVAAPWCTEQASTDAVTTSGAGDRASAAGVVAAFEHAYYVQRSGTAVAALMVSPAPPERIQDAIDQTPEGTEHCVTITPADRPDVSAVALTLRTPSGSESVIASRITTTRTDQSYAISSIEEIR